MKNMNSHRNRGAIARKIDLWSRVTAQCHIGVICKMDGASIRVLMGGVLDTVRGALTAASRK